MAALSAEQRSDDEAAIEITDLRKSYAGVEAVRGVSLRVRRGEILAFLGPNGAGKTTTVEILEGFRRRSSGEVRVLGVDPEHGDRGWRARIGIVLQEGRAQPELTVRETLELWSAYYPRPLAVQETIGLVGLGEKADDRVGRLSGGQRRRLDVGLALIGDPDLVFLDEPTTGFDPVARRAAWAVIGGLRELGKTVFLTTHYGIREDGILKRVRATPVAPWIVFAGRIGTAIVSATIVTTILVAIGALAFGVTVPTHTLPGLILTLAVGAATFCGLGIAYTRLIPSEEAAPAMTNAVVLPLYFISGVFVPADQLPSELRQVADLLPVKPFVDALVEAFDPHTTGAGIAGGDLLIVAAWGALGLLLAVRFFVWTPRHQAG